MGTPYKVFEPRNPNDNFTIRLQADEETGVLSQINIKRRCGDIEQVALLINSIRTIANLNPWEWFIYRQTEPHKDDPDYDDWTPEPGEDPPKCWKKSYNPSTGLNSFAQKGYLHHCSDQYSDLAKGFVESKADPKDSGAFLNLCGGGTPNEDDMGNHMIGGASSLSSLMNASQFRYDEQMNTMRPKLTIACLTSSKILIWNILGALFPLSTASDNNKVEKPENLLCEFYLHNEFYDRIDGATAIGHTSGISNQFFVAFGNTIRKYSANGKPIVIYVDDLGNDIYEIDANIGSGSITAIQNIFGSIVFIKSGSLYALVFCSNGVARIELIIAKRSFDGDYEKEDDFWIYKGVHYDKVTGLTDILDDIFDTGTWDYNSAVVKGNQLITTSFVRLRNIIGFSKEYIEETYKDGLNISISSSTTGETFILPSSTNKLIMLLPKSPMMTPFGNYTNYNTDYRDANFLDDKGQITGLHVVKFHGDKAEILYSKQFDKKGRYTINVFTNVPLGLKANNLFFEREEPSWDYPHELRTILRINIGKLNLEDDAAINNIYMRGSRVGNNVFPDASNNPIPPGEPDMSIHYWGNGKDQWPPEANENNYNAVGGSIKNVAFLKAGAPCTNDAYYNIQLGELDKSKIDEDGYLYLIAKQSTQYTYESGDVRAVNTITAMTITVKGTRLGA
ncbi:MAG: hypothetical protein DRQ46_00190 [Gammaproteobacteria bacterium]|nr:MAG: hypothetical protein DRQ46_00190 [Gammaproteobacteria bacterium]